MRSTLVCLLVLMTGCTSLPPEPFMPRPPRAQMEAFALDARIAIRHNGDRYSAQLNWQHEAESDTLFLTGPLGQGLARLQSVPGYAQLTEQNGAERSAPDLDSLSAEVFGTPLPITGLSRWILGLPQVAAYIDRDLLGRPSKLREAGWTVSYLSYENASAEALPVLIELTRENIFVRIKADTWNLNPDPQRVP